MPIWARLPVPHVLSRTFVSYLKARIGPLSGNLSSQVALPQIHEGQAPDLAAARAGAGAARISSSALKLPPSAIAILCLVTSSSRVPHRVDVPRQLEDTPRRIPYGVDRAAAPTASGVGRPLQCR